MKNVNLLLKKGQPKLLSILLLFMILSFVLTACVTNNPTVSDLPPDTNKEVGEESKPQEEPGKEKVINVSRSWERTNMDPASWTSSEDLVYGPSVFQNLLTYDENLNFVGELAERWEVLNDFKTFRFYLRKGVEFHHDYGEMKAGDVIFTFERMKDPEIKAVYAEQAIGLDNFKEIVAEDDYTVKIELKEKDINFLYKMASWYGYVISEKAVKDMGNDKFGLNPIGTGPFAFDKGVAGERTEVIKHAKYWGEKAKIDRIVFHIISEPATITNAFESGEIDFIYEFADTDKLLQYKEQPDKYYINSVPTRNYLYVGMNYQDEYFKNKTVRESLTYAIDRDEIIKDYFMGLEKPALGVIPTGTKYSVNDRWNPIYDPEKTKAMLAEAGYPNGIETEFYCPNDQLSMGPATLVQSYLAQAGINASLKTVDFGVFLDTVRNGKAPIWLLYDSTSILPDELIRRYTSEKIPGSNWCSFNDPEYDELANMALSAQTEESKKEYSEKAQIRLIDQTILYPVCTYTQHSVMQKRVLNFKLQPDLTLSFGDVDVE